MGGVQLGLRSLQQVLVGELVPVERRHVPPVPDPGVGGDARPMPAAGGGYTLVWPRGSLFKGLTHSQAYRQHPVQIRSPRNILPGTVETLGIAICAILKI